MFLVAFFSEIVQKTIEVVFQLRKKYQNVMGVNISIFVGTNPVYMNFLSYVLSGIFQTGSANLHLLKMEIAVGACVVRM